MRGGTHRGTSSGWRPVKRGAVADGKKGSGASRDAKAKRSLEKGRTGTAARARRDLYTQAAISLCVTLTISVGCLYVWTRETPDDTWGNMAIFLAEYAIVFGVAVFAARADKSGMPPDEMRRIATAGFFQFRAATAAAALAAQLAFTDVATGHAEALAVKAFAFWLLVASFGAGAMADGLLLSSSASAGGGGRSAWKEFLAFERQAPKGDRSR